MPQRKAAVPTKKAVKASDKGSWLKPAFSLVATPEWREWFYGLAQLNRAPGTVTVEQALSELAKRLGYKEPPPRT
jgi:hypothetical protein